MLACKEVTLVIFDVTTLIKNVCLKPFITIKALLLEIFMFRRIISKTEFFQIIGDHKRCAKKIFI